MLYQKRSGRKLPLLAGIPLKQETQVIGAGSAVIHLHPGDTIRNRLVPVFPPFSIFLYGFHQCLFRLIAQYGSGSADIHGLGKSQGTHCISCKCRFSRKMEAPVYPFHGRSHAIDSSKGQFSVMGLLSDSCKKKLQQCFEFHRLAVGNIKRHAIRRPGCQR